MMSDLEIFTKAMDGEWEVVKYELQDNDVLRVHYKSLANPEVGWSHEPFTFESVPKIGTRGRLGFITSKFLEEQRAS